MSFKEIIGHDTAVKFLRQVVENNELPPAYLFLGIDGIGKRLTALNLAKALNCQEGKADSCDQCPSCKKIEALNHPDVIWISLLEDSSFIKIEQIRQLKYQLSLKPYEARRKIAVILGSDLLNAESSNALLKTLEEPPANTLVILTATNASRIFSTIISRAQVVKFFPLPDEEIKKILIKEHEVAEDKAITLSRLSQGSVGAALRLNDKGILEKRDVIIDNLTGQDNNFWEEMFLRDGFKANFLDTLDIISSWYRDLLLLKVGADQNELANWDRKEDLYLMLKNYNLESIDKILNLIFELRREAEQNLNPKLLCQRLLLEIEGVKI